MRADAATTAAVRTALDELAQAYVRRDAESLLSLFAPDPDVLMYGTGADEKRLGRDEILAQAERDWAQSDATALVYHWTAVSAAGPVAWVAADASFQIKAGGEELTLPARITLVLERRGESWLVVHGHFSLPAAGQVEGESFPA